MLRLATELSVLPAERRLKPPAAARAGGQPAAAAPREKPALASRQAGTAADAVRIDKRSEATPRERADAEFARAMTQVNQGRIAEGVAGLKAALAADPANEPARQMLVALLLESRHIDDAAVSLQEGLAANPANTGLALLLARILIDRGDLPGALALLQKHEPAAKQDADYHGFLAALLQRATRHAEAVEKYRFALQLKPSAGAWWVGLGISQEALERPREAVESFRRAKAAGDLREELAGYVERRLKQLQ